MASKFMYRVFRALSRRLKAFFSVRRDRILCTFELTRQDRLAAFLSPLPTGLLLDRADDIRKKSEDCLGHRFNLLGSGTLQVYRGMKCAGFEGYQYVAENIPVPDAEGNWLSNIINASNLGESQRIWKLVDATYQPIDWQLDFRSGFRWSEASWYQHILFGHLPGVDVKMPWELTRMQHLPALALAYAAASEGFINFSTPDIYLREYRNQVLDFIATNPPRYGVNWVCPMDVAIRAVNILLAYDLFKSYNADFDSSFEDELSRSMRAHGAHIFGHLEWHPIVRGNHYLADLGGLLFIAAYLPADQETNSWLAYSLSKLPPEIEYQFQIDGSSFEGSTCYHRLSADIIAYSLAVALSLSEKRLLMLGSNTPQLSNPILGMQHPDTLRHISKIAKFLLDITGTDGRMPQIGDNDSGRFVKLLPPKLRLDNPVDDDLDPRQKIANIQMLLTDRGSIDVDESCLLEASLIRNLASANSRINTFLDGEQFNFLRPQAGSPPSIFPDFGLYVYRLNTWILWVRCGSNGIFGYGGHGHNDKLSFEIVLDGARFFTDSGSYTYTACPELRNVFRSTIAHNTLIVDDREQNDWPSGAAGVFSLGNCAQVSVIRADASGFDGCHDGYEELHRRFFSFGDDKIVCEDWFDSKRASSVVFNLDPKVRILEISSEFCHIKLLHDDVAMELSFIGICDIRVEEVWLSEGYGIRQSRQRIICKRNSNYSRIEFCRGQ